MSIWAEKHSWFPTVSTVEYQNSFFPHDRFGSCCSRSCSCCSLKLGTSKASGCIDAFVFVIAFILFTLVIIHTIGEIQDKAVFALAIKSRFWYALLILRTIGVRTLTPQTANTVAEVALFAAAGVGADGISACRVLVAHSFISWTLVDILGAEFSVEPSFTQAGVTSFQGVLTQKQLI